MDPNIAEGFDQWLKNMPLGVQPTMQEMADTFRLLANGKAVGPDGVLVELFKITFNGDPALCRSSGKMRSSWFSVKRRTRQSLYTSGGMPTTKVDPSIKVDWRIRSAWCSFRKYTLELYDRPSAPLELKTRMLRAEVLETMLYGCVTKSPRAPLRHATPSPRQVPDSLHRLVKAQ